MSDDTLSYIPLLFVDLISYLQRATSYKTPSFVFAARKKPNLHTHSHTYPLIVPSQTPRRPGVANTLSSPFALACPCLPAQRLAVRDSHFPRITSAQRPIAYFFVYYLLVWDELWYLYHPNIVSNYTVSYH